MDREAWCARFIGSQRVGHDWVNELNWIWKGGTSPVAQQKQSACNVGDYGFGPWVRKSPSRRKWQPTPVFLPEKSHGQRSLVGYSPWGSQKSRTQQWLYKTITWKEDEKQQPETHQRNRLHGIMEDKGGSSLKKEEVLLQCQMLMGDPGIGEWK